MEGNAVWWDARAKLYRNQAKVDQWAEEGAGPAGSFGYGATCRIPTPPSNLSISMSSVKIWRLVPSKVATLMSSSSSVVAAGTVGAGSPLLAAAVVGALRSSSIHVKVTIPVMAPAANICHRESLP
eukprot:COSAG05_NODE_2503_length_2969_cov_1.890125_1_plen_126_part_00